MAKNKNSFRLASAFARGLWFMDADGAHTAYIDFKAILAGSKVYADDDDLPEDEFVAPDPDDDDDDRILLDETGADDDDYPELQADGFTGKIALVNITGPIMHYGGPCNYGAAEYGARIMAYADDPSVSAVILVGNTPGGQVEGTQTWADAVKYFKSKKPILGYIDDGKVASAGVWGFSQCSEIYASHATCQFGSVGVMSCILDFRKAMEKEGVAEIITYAPQSTDKNKSDQDTLDGNPALKIAELKFLAGQFINAVSAGRGDKLTSEEWQTGKMYFAGQAKTIGLIDGIMPLAKVVQRAAYLATQSQQNSNQSNMFGKDKFTSLTALVGIAGAGITAAQVEAVNSQIEAQKIEGVTLALDSTLAVAEAAVTENTAVLAAINGVLGKDNAKASLTEAFAALKISAEATAASLATAKADIVALNAKVVEYGGKAADLPTGGVKADADVIPGDALPTDPYATTADADLAKIKAEMGYKKAAKK